MTPQLAVQLMPPEIQNKLFPMSLRPQAHDIITFWLFNTVLKSNLHYKKNPWKDTTISGFVTLKGEKMSKSKGNIIRPQTIIEQYGADAIRYWASSSKLGEDLDYQEKDVLTGLKFITKIYNATKFVFSSINYQKKMPILIETDRLFLSQLNNLIESAAKAFDKYNYSKAKFDTDNFFWKTFADNYLEIVKNRFYNGNEKEKASAHYTLYHSLLTILKQMAPITPFITEEIYHDKFKIHEKDKSIHISNWPKPIKLKENKTDQEVWDKLLDIVYKVRQEKSNAKKAMNSSIRLTIDSKDNALLSPVLSDLKAVTNSQEIKTGSFAVEFL